MTWPYVRGRRATVRPGRLASRAVPLVLAIVAAVSVVAVEPPVAGAQVYDVSNTPGRAEGEQTAAVNPADSSNVIVGSNQWLPSTSSDVGNIGIGPEGVSSCAVWSSHDGGRTWVGGRLDGAGLDALSGPLRPLVQQPSEFGNPDLGNVISADQNTVFDRRGNAYFQCVNSGAGSSDVKVFVYRSTDGGRTWGPPVTAFAETNTRIQIDRPFLAIDNSGGPRDGTLYLTYETMFYQAYLPEVYAESSTDGGRSWSAPVRADRNDNRAQWDPRQYPVVGADGTLYVVYDAAALVSPTPVDPSLTPLKLLVARSTDGGRTFNPSVVEPAVDRIQSPDEAFSYFTETISAIATDAARPGRVAVAWPDKRSGDARILLHYSLDGARTWSPVIDVPDDPSHQGNQHDHVALTYLPDGRLVVVWRDRRYGGGAFGGPLDVFARVFNPQADGNLLPGATVRVTESPQSDGQNTHGNMPTEYLGVTSSSAGLDVSWNELRGALLDDVFRRIPLTAFGTAPLSAAPVVPVNVRRFGGCIDRRGFSFRLHHPHGERIVRGRVLITGKRPRLLRGRNLRRLTLTRLPPRRFIVTIKTLTNRGTRATSTRVYDGCTKTRPRNHFTLGRQHHRHRSFLRGKTR